MEEADNIKHAFYEIGPVDKPYAKVMVPERRTPFLRLRIGVLF